MGREHAGAKRTVAESKATIAGLSSKLYRQKYPTIQKGSDTWKFAQYAAIAHHIPKNARDAFEAELEAMYRNSKVTGEQYSKKVVDKLVMEAMAKKAPELEEGVLESPKPKGKVTNRIPIHHALAPPLLLNEKW